MALQSIYGVSQPHAGRVPGTDQNDGPGAGPGGVSGAVQPEKLETIPVGVVAGNDVRRDEDDHTLFRVA